MFMTADEVTSILEKEERYMDSLKERWHPNKIDSRSEHYLRMGKRTELLGDLQKQQLDQKNQVAPA